MNSSGAEALASFAMLVSIGSFLIGLFVLISFFIMAINIGTITKLNRAIEHRQASVQSSLDKIVRLLEQAAKEKV